MSQVSRRRHLAIYLAIIVSTVAVFIGDLFTPLGVTSWQLYLVPITLCLFVPQRAWSLAVAVVASILLVIGFFASPGSVGRFTIFNRSVGDAVFWIVAIAGYVYVGSRIKLERFAWTQAGQMNIASAIRGASDPSQVASNVLRALANYTTANVGVLYMLDGGRLQRAASWALPEDGAPETLALGTGLSGQCAIEMKPLLREHLPADYLRLGSALGQSQAQHVLAVPITADGGLVAIIELGFAGVSERLADATDLITGASETIGLSLRSAQYRGRLEHLLHETQHQAEELQVQQEELRVTNEELEERGRALMDSQARLETQQTELEHSNVQLEEHAQRLEQQKKYLLDAQRDLTENTQALERANQYKSEFLANMSHELRTPLNSSLILAKLLQDNKLGNLSHEQVRYASTIYSSNTDLLSLINDILDLAKVEAGHMEVAVEPVTMESIEAALHQTFDPIAQEKGVGLRIARASDLPASMTTDQQRLMQILRNLLSNAFKFTERGEVVVQILPAPPAHVRFSVQDTGIGIAKQNLSAIFDAFRQADGTTSRRYGGSGLGLSISREFATLLGGDIDVASVLGEGSTFTLTIPLVYTEDAKAPRAVAMQGTVNARDAQAAGNAPNVSRASRDGGAYNDLNSTEALRAAGAGGLGSDSTSGMSSDAASRAAEAPTQRWSIPAPGRTSPAPAMDQTRDQTTDRRTGGNSVDRSHQMRPADSGPAAASNALSNPTGISDDRHNMKRDRRLILVIEDDEAFAHILYDLAHELDFDCVHAATGEDGSRLAAELQPIGILLDVGLPDDSGLTVLERLKRSPETRHIPIHMISVNDHAEAALHLGAIGYSLKPTAREELVGAIGRLEARLAQRLRRILVVEDDPSLRANIGLLLASDGVEISGVGTIADALTQLSETTFDCVVMDLTLPDGSGYDLLRSMADSAPHSFPPVIVYTGRSLTAEEERRLRYYSKSIIIKGAKSPERLLDEVTLFLHSVESELPPDQQRMLRQARQRDAAFEGRKILLAEDDVRNIFALSHVIEPLGAKLEIARNGREALEKVMSDPDIELVLMDIMMPEMDGLTAMREIRKLPGMDRLPIIALTAKAMSSDRQRCLDAGANDYISKPIEVDKLLSLCRVWLSH